MLERSPPDVAQKRIWFGTWSGHASQPRRLRQNARACCLCISAVPAPTLTRRPASLCCRRSGMPPGFHLLTARLPPASRWWTTAQTKWSSWRKCTQGRWWMRCAPAVGLGSCCRRLASTLQCRCRQQISVERSMCSHSRRHHCQGWSLQPRCCCCCQHHRRFGLPVARSMWTWCTRGAWALPWSTLTLCRSAWKIGPATRLRLCHRRRQRRHLLLGQRHNQSKRTPSPSSNLRIVRKHVVRQM